MPSSLPLSRNRVLTAILIKAAKVGAEWGDSNFLIKIQIIVSILERYGGKTKFLCQMFFYSQTSLLLIVL